MRRSFQGIQWPGSVEASVSDRYPAFTVHYRVLPGKLERNFFINCLGGNNGSLIRLKVVSGSKRAEGIKRKMPVRHFKKYCVNRISYNGWPRVDHVQILNVWTNDIQCIIIGVRN